MYTGIGRDVWVWECAGECVGMWVCVGMFWCGGVCGSVGVLRCE